MKSPYSKLPWSSHEDQRTGWVNSNDGYIVVEHTWKSSQRRTNDLDYLTEACNNYPKTIELLKNIYSDRIDSPEMTAIEEFLKDKI